MKNHYIPCFYTKRWTCSDGKLTRFSKPYHRIEDRRKYPSEVGFLRDLYTIPGVAKDVKDLLETRFFRRLDQDASNVLDKMDAGKILKLSQNERFSWSVFLISLRQRNPTKVAALADQVQENLDSAINGLREEVESGKREVDVSAFEDQIRRAIDTQWFERVKKIQLQDAILLPRSAEAVMNFVWYLVDIWPQDFEILSSDRPLIMSNGLAADYGHLVLPIGPKKIFIACRNNQVFERIIAQKNIASTINEVVVRQAQNEVYAKNSSQKLFVDRRLTPAASP